MVPTVMSIPISMPSVFPCSYLSSPSVLISSSLPSSLSSSSILNFFFTSSLRSSMSIFENMAVPIASESGRLSAYLPKLMKITLNVSIGLGSFPVSPKVVSPIILYL